MWVTPKFAPNSFFFFVPLTVLGPLQKIIIIIITFIYLPLQLVTVYYIGHELHICFLLVERDKEINHRILPLLEGKVRFRGGVRTHPQGFFLSAVLDAFYITSVVSFSLLCMICNPLDTWSLVRDLVPPVCCAHCKHLEWIVDSYKHGMQWRK